MHMDVPVEISFKNLDSSVALEDRIRAKVAKLEEKFDCLVACRVAISLPHRQHQQGNVPNIRIDMTVRGQEIVVNHDAHHAEQRHDEPGFSAALNEAFRAAERKLAHYRGSARRASRQPRALSL
jgi:ribosome-associated translation inhibitor RaiA